MSDELKTAAIQLAANLVANTRSFGNPSFKDDDSFRRSGEARNRHQVNVRFLPPGTKELLIQHGVVTPMQLYDGIVEVHALKLVEAAGCTDIDGLVAAAAALLSELPPESQRKDLKKDIAPYALREGSRTDVIQR